jgi:hypothetical protein
MQSSQFEVAAQIPILPEVIKALSMAQTALAGDSNDDEHDALLALVESLEKCKLVTEVSSSIQKEPATKEVPVECIKLNVPTYNGKWLQKYPLQDFDEPHVPLLVHPADGLRVVLGTHDFYDMSKSDIQIERRHNGWMIFLHRDGGDPVGFVVFLDDGRNFVTIDHYAEEAIQVVDFDEAVAELDDIKPGGISCSPATILKRERFQQ